MGIEPTFEAWEAPVLPLNYTREMAAGPEFTTDGSQEPPPVLWRKHETENTAQCLAHLRHGDVFPHQGPIPVVAGQPQHTRLAI